MALIVFWRTVKRRWKLVTAIFVVTVLLVLGAFLLWPTRYESDASLNFSFDSSDMMQLDDNSLGSLGSNDEQTKLDTQVQILQNKDLILDVVGRLDLARNPEFYKFARPGIDSANLDPWDQGHIVKAFISRLKVRAFPKTYLVSVSFRSRKPELAQRILSELLAEYKQRSLDERFEDTKDQTDWLQLQINDLRVDVQKNERRLVQLQQENGLLLMGLPMGGGGGTSGGQSQASGVATAASVQLGEVIKARVTGEADRIEKEGMYRASLSGDPELLASIVPQSKIVILRQQQASLTAQLSALKSRFGDQYPDVVAAQTELADVNAAIKKEVVKLQEQLKEEYQASQHAEDLLTKSEDLAKSEAFKQIGAAAELIALQEEVESGQRLYEDLERKLKESSVLAGLKSTQVDIVAKPDLAYKPAEPSPLIFAAIALVLAPLVSGSLAILRENADRTLRNSYEIEEIIGVPVLASIPHQSLQDTKAGTTFSSVMANAIFTGKHKSRLTEAFRSLLSTVLLSSTRRPKVFVITSSMPGEGKSSLSLGLASVMMQRQARVLLIEADMRRPTIHVVFPPKRPSVGLATVLSENSTFEESIFSPPELPLLTILPSGPVPPYPAELLDSAVMTQLLERVRREFDFVLIDTPPLLSVSDALPLTKEADLVLLAVRSRLTRRHALTDVNVMLERTGTEASGVILNDVIDMDSNDYYYGYSSEYAVENDGEEKP